MEKSAGGGRRFFHLVSEAGGTIQRLKAAEGTLNQNHKPLIHSTKTEGYPEQKCERNTFCVYVFHIFLASANSYIILVTNS